MNIEELRAYCLSKAYVTESFPFDEKTLVFKVGGKMFALTGLERFPPAINLKCDPDYALELRDVYEAIQPGFHMNKKHWNTIYYQDEVSPTLLLKLVDHSYDLVVKSLTKKVKTELGLM
ncbi:MmcQ/YjbR family DNA-binding protein [Flavicella sediminum]|uniref:MmcQ/YjbR family DNA-binding protein n=1 Tax=Flavicella sediminum TaxID=2585141 RepID=UPI00111FFDAC|nr:MmcQ/YjbR family DNA-binding protein [Flavicella sediminum]